MKTLILSALVFCAMCPKGYALTDEQQEFVSRNEIDPAYKEWFERAAAIEEEFGDHYAAKAHAVISSMEESVLKGAALKLLEECGAEILRGKDKALAFDILANSLKVYGVSSIARWYELEECLKNSRKCYQDAEAYRINIQQQVQ